MRLYERISIDTWKRIADRVQKLNIYDNSSEEFNWNLEELRRMVSDLEISLDYGMRYPGAVEDIGLVSLLEGIYSSNVYMDYKKANFYEKIHQLDEIGIPSIEFRPAGFIDRVEGISVFKNSITGEAVGVRKCFTDGEFRIAYPDNPMDDVYGLYDLKEDNYLINVLVELDTSSMNPVVNPSETYAILRNFNGEYPNKESIEEIRYPGLCTYYKNLDDGRRQLILKQIFYKFDTRNAKYSKKLVREPFNYHYE